MTYIVILKQISISKSKNIDFFYSLFVNETHQFALKPQHNIKNAFAELLFKKQLSYKFGETAAKA